MGYTKELSVDDLLDDKTTESLSKWVSKVKRKSKKAKRNRDFRKIAILYNSLLRAESELIEQQRERARRWSQLRDDLGITQEEEENDRLEREKVDTIWKTDLSGLDDFFKQLDQIKTPKKYND